MPAKKAEATPERIFAIFVKLSRKLSLESPVENHTSALYVRFKFELPLLPATNGFKGGKMVELVNFLGALISERG